MADRSGAKLITSMADSGYSVSEMESFERWEALRQRCLDRLIESWTARGVYPPKPIQYSEQVKRFMSENLFLNG